MCSISISSSTPSDAEDSRHPVAAEEAHQVVIQREIELAAAGVALTAGTAAQLVVDAARFMPFSADDIQAARRNDLFVFGRRLLLELSQQAP